MSTLTPPTRYATLLRIAEANKPTPQPYAGRVPVYVKLGTGPGRYVWLPPGKAQRLAVGQKLQVYMGPDRFSRKAGVLVDGVHETGNGRMWVMELF